jgi:hypothetical protein
VHVLLQDSQGAVAPAWQAAPQTYNQQEGRMTRTTTPKYHDTLTKRQLMWLRQFTDRLFGKAWQVAGSRLEDFYDTGPEGDGVFTGDCWSRKAEYAINNEVTVTVVVTAFRRDKEGL